MLSFATLRKLANLASKSLLFSQILGSARDSSPGFGGSGNRAGAFCGLAPLRKGGVDLGDVERTLAAHHAVDRPKVLSVSLHQRLALGKRIGLGHDGSDPGGHGRRGKNGTDHLACSLGESVSVARYGVDQLRVNTVILSIFPLPRNAIPEPPR